jgi:hypothetical protein
LTITYGADFVKGASTSTDSVTITATLGSTGANAILFVLVEAEGDYSDPIGADYNGTALTSLGGKVEYTATATIYRELFYLNANLTSGQDIHVFSGTPTTLGQTGSKAWAVSYWTYSGVSSIGSTSVNSSNFVTASSGTAATVAFDFTPTVSSSTVLQILAGVGQCRNGYAAASGTVRESIAETSLGAITAWVAFSDHKPGSTSQYSLSQDFNPQFCTNSAYGWGVELR